MKKLITLSLALSLAFTSLTACGGNEATNLVWSNWVGAETASKDAIAEMITSYNADAELDVEQINWGWGDTTSNAILRAQGTQAYDIAQLDIRMLPALAEAGVLADLGKEFGNDYFNIFPQSSLEIGKYDGVQYGVPWTAAPMAMIANPTILEEVNFTKEIITIADFEEALEAVKNHPDNFDEDQTNDIIPYGAMTSEAGTLGPDFMPWIWTYGGSVFKDGTPNFADQKTKDALVWFKGLSDDGYIQQGMTRNDARTNFKNGRIAFIDDALVAKGSVVSEDAVLEDVAMPMARPVLAQGDTPKALGWGHVLVVLKNSKNKAEAKKFISHILSEECAMNYFNECGTIPATTALLAKDEVKNDYWVNSWNPIITAGGKTSETAGIKEAAYNKVIADNIVLYLAGTKTLDETVSAIDTGLTNA